MKYKLPLLGLAIVVIISFFLINSGKKQIDTAKVTHQAFIDNHPYQKSLKLTKAERKEQGRIQGAKAPNKYFEQEYLLEMNPATGKTEPEKLFALQERLRNNQQRTPGSTTATAWVERGPDNVPGRTRAILYDPNDATHKRVFAGGVSGGLWVIDDIENENSVWQRIGIPENLAVSSITVDVNDSNVFYVGTGESYVGGDVNGNGVWKSTDGGATWAHVFGGSTGTTSVVSNAILTVTAPNNIAGNYVAVSTTNFGNALTSLSANLVLVNANAGTANEGCFPLTNGAAISGNIAVVDRGTCNFSEKAYHAQNSGAIGLIVLNSVDSFPFNMAGGVNADDVTIPSVMMSKDDGELLKNAMAAGTVSADLNAVVTDLPVGITLIPGKFHVNDIVTRNNNGVTEIYAAISESQHTSGGYVLGGEYGLYKSVDQGVSWALLTMPLSTEGNRLAPNDLLITSDNTLWVATTNSWSFGNGGGRILSSTDGTTFTQKFNVPNGTRTQIAASPSTNPNTIYVLANTGVAGTPSIGLFKTTSAFNFPTVTLTKPNDGILSDPTDFTGRQAFYNLTIAVDPTDVNKVYLGGINTFKTSNGGTSWQKTSVSRSNSTSLSAIHSDVHKIIFHPTDTNKGLIGTDGGVYYVNSFSTAHANPNAMSSRGKGYNTTQFYKGAIGQNLFNEQFLGGSQDNGTNYINGATAGINSSSEVGGADGMYCFIDKGGQYMITSIYQNAYFRRSMSGAYQATIVNNQGEGSFVNVAELDDNLNILFSNAHTGSGSSIVGKISRFVNVNMSPTRYNLQDALLTRPVTAMKVSPYSTTSTTLMVGTDTGSIFKIIGANNRPGWFDLTPEPFVTPFRGSISAINFGANENEIMVTFHNYGVVSVYYTEDAGVTWQNKEGNLPDLPVKDIMMNPLLNDEVIIATALGVWKTSNFKDANPIWTQSHNGMQNVKVTSLELRTLDKTVLASTYGRGFFTGRFTAEVAASDDVSMTTKKLVVYPTVSNGELTISTTTNLQDVKVSIVDINGKEVYTSQINISDKEHINLNVANGIYFVNFKGNEVKESHKIIIK